MKKLLVTLFASLALTVQALPKDSDLWVELATSVDSGLVYSALRGSGELTKNDNGVPIYAVRGRVVSKNDNTTTPTMWYVTLESCTRGQGLLVIMNGSGKYLSNAKFAFGSGSVSAAIAELLCAAAEVETKPNSNKSYGPTI